MVEETGQPAENDAPVRNAAIQDSSADDDASSNGSISDESSDGFHFNDTSDDDSSDESLGECFYTTHEVNGCPSARAHHSADMIGSNQVYVLGGWNGKTSLGDLHVFNIDAWEWKQLSISDSPHPRFSVRRLKRDVLLAWK